MSSKIIWIVVGLVLYSSNPWRDLTFYERVAENEGFGTTADAYIVGFAGQLLATITFAPIAIGIIIYGIGRARYVAFMPVFRFSWWAFLSSVILILIVLIEAELLFYTLRFSHHVLTTIITIGYLFFSYVWWCSSLTHGQVQNKPEAGNGGKLSGQCESR